MSKNKWMTGFLALLFVAAFIVGYIDRAEASGFCSAVWKDCTTGQATASGGLVGDPSKVSTTDTRLSDARTPTGNITVGDSLGASAGTETATSTSVALSSTPKIRIVGDGNSSHYLNGALGWTTPAGGGGGDAFPIADSDCPIYWKMDEGVPAFANSGNAGTLNLGLYGNASILGREGQRKLGPVLVTPSSTGGKGFLITDTTTLGESNSLTMSLWLYVTDYGTAWAPIMIKNYRADDSWSTPFGAAGIQFNGDVNGSLQALVATGGTAKSKQVTAAIDRVPLNRWTHLALTYSASTGVLTVYKNGVVVATLTTTAANIDWGTHGRWFSGGLYVAGGPDFWLGRIDEVYIDSTVWDAAKVQGVAWTSAHYN